ncbi:MAG: cytochrome c3 family protein [candidate division Zixibacteria bacterium]
MENKSMWRDHTTTRRNGVRLFIALASVGVLLLLSGVALSSSHGPDNETCLGCHDEYEAMLEGRVHQLGTDVGQVSCSACHAGGDVHIDDPSESNITNPATADGEEGITSCTNCHQPHMQRENVGFDAHIGLSLSCATCHAVHKKATEKGLDDQAGMCGKCHISVVNRFRLRSAHPLTDEAVTCTSCHDFGGNSEPEYGHGANARCYSCHPEQSGPYLSEHEAASSYAVEGEGCVSCHNPHGSVNERLLTQVGDPLCYQCHGEPAGHLTAHNGQYAGFDCMECHREVHGSYEHKNRYLLDPNLGAKLGGTHSSCYCHRVEN